MTGMLLTAFHMPLLLIVLLPANILVSICAANNAAAGPAILPNDAPARAAGLDTPAIVPPPIPLKNAPAEPGSMPPTLLSNEVAPNPDLSNPIALDPRLAIFSKLEAEPPPDAAAFPDRLNIPASPIDCEIFSAANSDAIRSTVFLTFESMLLKPPLKKSNMELLRAD